MPLKSSSRSVGAFATVSSIDCLIIRDLLARPKISEVVQDTKVLLQQSRERLVITFVVFVHFCLVVG